MQTLLPTIAIITVSYNSAAVLPGLLASVPAGVPHIVVDNDSRDTSAALVSAAGAIVVQLQENVGFSRGCNAGAGAAAAGDAELLFFLNPDCILQPDTITALQQAALAYPDAAAFTPLTHKNTQDKLFSFRSLLAPYLPNPQNIKHWPQGDCCIPMASGGALCVRRAAFTKVGGFDENIFMFFEDDDLCARLIKQCGAIVHVQGAVITHMVGTGSKRSWRGLVFKNRKFAESQLYIYRKYNLPLRRRRLQARAVLGMLGGVLSLSRARLAKHYGRWLGLQLFKRQSSYHVD